MEDAACRDVHACVCTCWWNSGWTPPSVQSHLANRRRSQGGPGHLYLLKNKVATFAKVEKEEDMIQ